MSQPPLHVQSLSTVCRQLKSGALSSLDVTRTMLARCEAHDGKYQSYARMLADSDVA
jgi:Asp-tRNA(Asn)/Glu-tRNA(Gln) amidotransferase A subunit family amidase